MPNHMHAIISIIDEGVGNGRDRSLLQKRNSHDCSLQRNPKIKSLSEIIGAFKTTSSKRIHQLGLKKFKWQKSFYDHIMTSEKSLNEIREYVHFNPAQWSLGNGYPEDLLTFEALTK